MIISFSNKVNGVLTDATSIVLSDPTGAFGVRRTDTNAVVVADSVAMTHDDGTGLYSYSFTEPATGLTYEYWIEWVYGGETYRVQKFSSGPGAGYDITSTEGQILVNLPAGVNLTINGVTFTPTQVLALPEVNGVFELAMAWIFRTLESDHLKSETIGKYSYEKWNMRGSDYWQLRAAGKALDGTAPNVALRPTHHWGGCR